MIRSSLFNEGFTPSGQGFEVNLGPLFVASDIGAVPNLSPGPTSPYCVRGFRPYGSAIDLFSGSASSGVRCKREKHLLQPFCLSPDPLSELGWVACFAVG